MLVLVALALLPSTAGAQTDYPLETTTTQVAGDSTTTTPTSTTTTEAPEETTTTVKGDEVENTSSTSPSDTQPSVQPEPEVKGDVVSRPLPRTGNDIGGTAIFGGALTVLGVALALGARKRRNSFDGA